MQTNHLEPTIFNKYYVSLSIDDLTFSDIENQMLYDPITSIQFIHLTDAFRSFETISLNIIHNFHSSLGNWKNIIKLKLNLDHLLLSIVFASS